MPRERPGYESIRLEMPAELLAAIRAAAVEAGLPLSTYLIRPAAKRVGLTYDPRPVGRPRKLAPPPAPKKKRRR